MPARFGFESWRPPRHLATPDSYEQQWSVGFGHEVYMTSLPNLAGSLKPHNNALAKQLRLATENTKKKKKSKKITPQFLLLIIPYI